MSDGLFESVFFFLGIVFRVVGVGLGLGRDVLLRVSFVFYYC